MKTLLINCSFYHYPQGSVEFMPAYAMIIKVEENTYLAKAIYDELIKLNFNLQDWQFIEKNDLRFTAQDIS